ncbi:MULTISPECIES: DUF5954 family protein [unclassified Streptomyces]|uniref:DUF5954 family protein n=1 Tax=unclassified Streptomyces TaxID=2593676 RepID=UPI001E5D3E4B|nr:DUF5954 family protein [Streptomyces sp. CB02980]MCB8906757.1 DUF5954 family protein [Streptomyces sp. CB02980]
MREEGAGPVGWPVVVRVPVEPVEALVEADAREAAVRNSALAVRGPLFGVVSQGQDDGQRWRVVVEVTHGCPQQARDALNSLLWFRAKDEAKNLAERRALLAAVARLETECVDELTVLSTRYRVARAEEYAALDEHGGIETPRPTDPEPLTPGWSPGAGARSPRVDDGLVLDPNAPLSPLQAAERLSLRSLAYTGTRFPDAVLHDAAQAVETHPDVLLMPAAFLIVERSGSEPWTPGSGLQATAHDARRTLAFALAWMEPRTRGLIPYDAETDVDAHTVVTENTHPAVAELAVFADAADRLRSGRLHEVEVHGTVSRIGRARRLLRWGPDGPEGPRPSDINTHAPSALHPPMNEHGTVHFEEPAEGEAAP